MGVTFQSTALQHHKDQGVNVTDLAYKTSRDPFVRYVNISSPEGMIQVETGYIDKNTWLDWITHTASTNNMIECVACSTARPTLFTVTAPLLFREDRQGFDCMLQLRRWVMTTKF